MAIAAPDIGGGTNTKLAAALAAQKKVLANVASTTAALTPVAPTDKACSSAGNYKPKAFNRPTEWALTVPSGTAYRLVIV